MPKSNPKLAAAMGKRMAARRKELHLKQERVAELAGISNTVKQSKESPALGQIVCSVCAQFSK